MDIAKLGERIKQQRERRRLRQADLAAALQVSAQAVSKWERGENAPDITALPALARLLGVSADWLLGATTPDTDTFEATVFCTSLNGFAERAASMRPRETAAWANGIFYSLTETVKRFDGVPVKYVGDGSLAFFAGADHARRALDAALKARETPHNPDLVITLNTGEIFFGTVGHPDYERTDIIGETVNTAFLAMQWVAANCGTGVGVTGATVKAAGARGLARRGEIRVAGAARPVAIYEPARPARRGSR